MSQHTNFYEAYISLKKKTNTKKHVKKEQSGAIAVETTAAEVGKVTGIPLVRLSVGKAAGWDDFESEMARQSTDFAPVPVDAEDPAIMFYTSGSTGLPKGVLHASRALFSWRGSAWYWLSLTEDDVMWCASDTGWA